MNPWLIAFTGTLPTLITIVDTSIVNVSPDHIRKSLSATYDESTYAITAYLVSNAIIIPMAVWFSRLIGRKKFLVWSIVLFSMSSFLCGSVWCLQSLLFFSIVQGLGGGAAWCRSPNPSCSKVSPVEKTAWPSSAWVPC